MGAALLLQPDPGLVNKFMRLLIEEEPPPYFHILEVQSRFYCKI